MEHGGIVTPSGFKLNVIIMSKKQKKIYSVKVRLKSHTLNVKISPSIRSGLVMSDSSKSAEETALKIFNEDTRLIGLGGFAEIISSKCLRQDFVFKTEE